MGGGDLREAGAGANVEEPVCPLFLGLLKELRPLGGRDQNGMCQTTGEVGVNAALGRPFAYFFDRFYKEFIVEWDGHFELIHL